MWPDADNFSPCSSYSVLQFKLWRTMAFVLLCCTVLFQATFINVVAGLQARHKVGRELEAILRQREAYRKLGITSNNNHYKKVIGSGPPPSSSSAISSLTNEVNKPYRPDELIRNIESSVVLPHNQQPNSKSWLTQYTADHQSPSVSAKFPPNVQMKTEASHSSGFKSNPPQYVNPENDRTVQRKWQQADTPKVQTKDFYRKVYGTDEGVKYLKGNYGPANLTQAKINHGVEKDLEEVRLANEHFLQMRNSIRCHVPLAEVVCVKELYSSPDKDYLPRCTLLHRCGNRSGCCDSEHFKCVPRAIQEVALNFYIVPVHRSSDTAPPENSVEKLLFENHTECECAPVNDTPSTTPQEESTTQVPQQGNDVGLTREETSKTAFTKCRQCPHPFTYREYEDGRCSCDCFDKQKPCIKIKKGREPLLDRERRCVESRKCHIPDCEYGMYMSSTGRCPKRPEDFQKQSKNSGNNQNHRWTFFERD